MREFFSVIDFKMWSDLQIFPKVCSTLTLSCYSNSLKTYCHYEKTANGWGYPRQSTVVTLLYQNYLNSLNYVDLGTVNCETIYGYCDFLSCRTYANKRQQTISWIRKIYVFEIKSKPECVPNTNKHLQILYVFL